MKKLKSNFFKVPNAIYDLGLNSKELLILIYLISFSEKEEIYPSKKNIGKVCGISKRTVDKVIKSLVNKKIIYYRKGFIGYSNRYNISFKNIDPKCVTVKIRTSGSDMEEKVNKINCDKIISEVIENSSLFLS